MVRVDGWPSHPRSCGRAVTSPTEELVAARTKSKIHPKYKTCYRVTNWPAYDAALRKRGDITVWFDDDAIASWRGRPQHKRGAPRRYSDLAITTALTLRLVFHLPLRQAEGFVRSLLAVMDLDLEAPDHTTLSRRNKTVDVPMLSRRLDDPMHLVIDSTGLKMLGDGEWHAHKHATSNKRRTWRKLHLGVDGEGFIVASALTERTRDDGPVAVELIDDLDRPVERFTGDGAYDTQPVYAALTRAGTADIEIIVPPRRTASATRSPNGVHPQRAAAIARIGEVGRRQWRKEVGADQQARAENAVFRYKRTFGDRLRSKGMEAQRRERTIGVNILNKMALLGKPISEAIAA